MSSQLPHHDQQQEPFVNFLEDAYVKPNDILDIYAPEEPVNEYLFTDSDFDHNMRNRQHGAL